jgi:hypothetical protein
MVNHRERLPLPLCRSRRDRRRADCVLRRGDKPDRVLGAVLRDYSNLTLSEAIKQLSEAGW